MNSRLKILQRAFAGAIGAAGLLVAGIAAAVPKPESGWGLPHDVSENGHDIDSLIMSTAVFLIILFVAMCAWILWAAIVHNEKHEAKYDHGDSRTSIRTAVLMAAGIFFVVDGNLFVNSEIDLNKTFWNFEAVDKDPKTIKIEINAHQWAWDARYAGPDGKFNTQDDIVTLNDIRVPVGVPVLFQLASVDVIHSFYLPNLRIKQDAVPGMINPMWFQAKETGEFDIGCAQHCGVNHYKMKGRLTVLTPEQYAEWAADASQRSARGYDAKDTAAHWGWDWKIKD
jgi:cytochrome c oxidase subunit 2